MGSYEASLHLARRRTPSQGSGRHHPQGDFIMDQAAQPLPERDTALAEAQGELEKLIGLPGVKEEVKRLMSFLKIQLERRRHGMHESSQSLHFVFTGNPGTGKTTVARILGKIFFGFGILKTPKVVECDRSKLVGGYVGQTAIKTDEVIQSALDGVLFIDEAYTLAADAAKYGQADRFGEEAINTLLKQMEDSRDRLIVIVAGYPAEMETFLRSNPGLQSRFTRFIRFEDYSVADLCRIFDRFCRDQEYSLTPLACAMAFVLFAVAYQRRDERFGNARHVRNMYEKALSMQADRLASRGGNLDKSTLATIDGQDILLGFDSADFDPRSVILPESKWEAECPGCGKPSTVQTRFLGQRITCGCGQKFIYPWWSLVPGSTPGLPSRLLLTPRPGDKCGIVEPLSPTPKVKGPEIKPAVAPKPIPAAPAPLDDATTCCIRGMKYANGDGVPQSDTEAAAWYLNAAEQGDATGQFLLGTMYEKGRGVRESATEAAAWYRKSAKQGNATAQWCLGTMYEDGRGLRRRSSDAAAWFRKAAEQGLATAQCDLGGMYRDGRGVPQSHTEAVYWYRQAAAQGDASGQVCLGIMFAFGHGVPENAAEAVFWYRNAADQGLRLAQDRLGHAYETGHGVPMNKNEAMRWYRKAADQGYERAKESVTRLNNAPSSPAVALPVCIPEPVMKRAPEPIPALHRPSEAKKAGPAVHDKVVDEHYDLAVRYQAGRGLPQSDTKAAALFRLAAEGGHAIAQDSLGEMYEKGRGVSKNDTEAVVWYRKAAEQGDDLAQHSLGQMYEDGRGVPRSDAKAVVWYRKAAEHGLGLAQTSLGGMLRDGRGVPKNETEAVAWFRKAAEQGLSLAQHCLGGMYEYGCGVKRNDIDAAVWYRKAAEQGLSAAQYKLGQAYESSRGVPMNKNEALLWYRKAADQGHERANEALTRINNAKNSPIAALPARILLGIGGKQTGPFSLEQVRAMLKSGQLSLATWYWQDGMKAWKPVSELIDVRGNIGQ